MNRLAPYIVVILFGVSGFTDAEEGSYRYPAEWEPHDYVLMGIRTRETEAVRKSGHRHNYDRVTIPMLRALTPHTPVVLVIEEGRYAKEMLPLLRRSGVDTSRVKWITQDPTAIWYRDIGPMFLTNGRSLAVADVAFSDYANVPPEAYTPRARALGGADRNVARRLGLPTVRTSLVMEGGSITVNGKGTAILSRLTIERNPHLDLGQIEGEVERVFGVTNVIWVEEGLVEDQQEWKKISGNYWAAGSGGHTDEFVSFLDDRTVALSWVSEDERALNPVNRINYERMSRNLEILEAATDQDGQPLRVIKLPLPDVQYEEVRLPPSNIPLFRETDPTIKAGDVIRWVAVSSYMNFVLTNGVVLVPKFWTPGQPDRQKQKDEQVREIFETKYPERQVVQINPLDLNHMGGGMHCLVQYQPSLP